MDVHYKTWPIFVSIVLPLKKFQRFRENNKCLLPKVREEMIGEQSTAITRKAVVKETHSRKSANVYKPIEEMHGSHSYPLSMCQPLTTGRYTRYEFDGADSRKFKALQIKTRRFENLIKSYFQQMRSDCRIESFYTTCAQKKLIAFM